jgi:hypothetical protein
MGAPRWLNSSRSSSGVVRVVKGGYLQSIPAPDLVTELIPHKITTQTNLTTQFTCFQLFGRGGLWVVWVVSGGFGWFFEGRGWAGPECFLGPSQPIFADG